MSTLKLAPGIEHILGAGAAEATFKMHGPLETVIFSPSFAETRHSIGKTGDC
jgi:hypothetical protein